MHQVYIVPTYKCNNNCPMCGVYNSKKTIASEYSLEEIKEKIDQQEIEKDDVVILSGGEPTIYRYFFEVLHYLQEKEAKITIFSNGRMMRHKTFVDELKKCTYDNLMIPLFGSKANIHDKLTGAKNSFAETSEGLLNLEENGMKYSIKTVIMKENYKDLPLWAEYVTSKFKNANQISIHGLHLQGEATKETEKLYVSHQLAAEYVEQSIDILVDIGVNVAISAIPLCVLDPYYWKYNIVSGLADYDTISHDSKEIKETNRENYCLKPQNCKKCRISAICEWPWRMYQKKYSLDYLNSI